jgi:transcriptional regulator with XRE-family HTH domain
MTGQQAKRLRKQLGMNQAEFWSRCEVTQSAASHYEHGRDMPKPVVKLLTIAYGTEKQREAALKKLGAGPRTLRFICR